MEIRETISPPQEDALHKERVKRKPFGIDQHSELNHCFMCHCVILSVGNTSNHHSQKVKLDVLDFTQCNEIYRIFWYFRLKVTLRSVGRGT